MTVGSKVKFAEPRDPLERAARFVVVEDTGGNWCKIDFIDSNGVVMRSSRGWPHGWPSPQPFNKRELEECQMKNAKPIIELTPDQMQRGKRLLVLDPRDGSLTQYIITAPIGYAQYAIDLRNGMASTRPQLIDFWNKRGGQYAIVDATLDKALEQAAYATGAEGGAK